MTILSLYHKGMQSAIHLRLFIIGEAFLLDFVMENGIAQNHSEAFKLPVSVHWVRGIFSPFPIPLNATGAILGV